MGALFDSHDDACPPPGCGDFACRRNRLAGADRSRRGARAGSDRRRRRAGDRRRRQHFHQADGGHEPQRGAAAAAGLAVRGVLRGVLQEPAGQERRADAAPHQFARLRFHHRCVRAGGHQQPRHQRRRRGQRHPQRRHYSEGRGHRPRHQDRSGAAQGQADQAAEGGQVRRLGHAAAGRVGDRDRQSVQPGRHGDRRHRLGAQSRYPVRPLRQLHPDRRRHQPRQFGRAAVQPRRRGGGRQHRDHLALRRLDRHRLRGAVEDRDAGDRPAARVQGSAARLARRAHPAGDRTRLPTVSTSSRRAARWSPASTTRARPSPPASSRATSSSSSTARTSRRCAICRASSPTRRSARTLR